MGAITLQSRQSLSRRVQSFGSLNNRGGNRRLLFGDAASDRADIEAEIANMNAGLFSHLRNSQLINTRDWAALYDAYPTWARDAYFKINSGSMEAEYEPTIDVWLSHRAPAVVNTPGNTPVIVDVPAQAPVVVSPGTTDKSYQDAVAAAQAEALRLQSMAAAKQAETRAESARIAAENEAANQKAIDDEATRDNSVEPKPNAFPWLIAAGVAFLVLKG